MRDRFESMLTRTEVAARLRIDPSTVDRMTARGELRTHRVGRFPRYLWSEILADTEQVPVDEQVRVALLHATGRP